MHAFPLSFFAPVIASIVEIVAIFCVPYCVLLLFGLVLPTVIFFFSRWCGILDETSCSSYFFTGAVC